MSKLQWDKTGSRLFETGVSNGVLYPMSNNPSSYEKGVVWNGLTSVTESPEGAEVTPVYADNIKYLNLQSAEDFKATISAYTYPDEFGACDGSIEIAKGLTITQQSRKAFGLSYRTKIGNDQNPELGYKIHIIYNCLASPSERSYETVNDSPEAIEFSWELTTTPVEVTGYKPTAHIEIDSTKCDKEALARLEDALYGSADSEAKLLLPDEIVAIFKEIIENTEGAE